MNSIADTHRTTRWRQMDRQPLAITTANIAHREGISLFEALKKAQVVVFNFHGQPERIKNDLTETWSTVPSILKQADKYRGYVEKGVVLPNWKEKYHKKRKS